MSPIWSGVYETIGNGNLNILPTSPVGTILAVGPCSKVASPEVYYYGRADVRSIRDELGYGDLPDRLLDFFALAGQKAKAIVVPSVSDGTKAIGPIQHDGGGPVATINVASPIVGTFDIIVEIVLGGAHETAKYRYSWDDGANWSNVFVTPAQGSDATLAPTGVQISWATGAFVAGAIYTFTVIGPSSSEGEISIALNMGVATGAPFEIAGVFTRTVANTWTSLGTWAENQFADLHQSLRVVTEASFPSLSGTPQDYVTARLAEIAGFANDRVAVCAGVVEVVDAFGFNGVRGLSGLTAGLIAGSPVFRSIGSTKYCQLTPVTRLTLELSPAELQTLDEARYIVPRTYVGLGGYYVNNGNIAANSTSDFQSIEICRVLDNVIRNVRTTALGFVHSEIRVKDGFADPASLKALEGACQNTLDALKSTFSSASIEIPEGQPVLQTQTINAVIQVVPFGYMKRIELGFNLARL